ncbi:MAG: VOC family protein [Armatimonadaceae bacterium]
MTRLHHVNIVVADMERSLGFYRDLLGMRATFDIELEGKWIETVVGLPGATARCVFVQPDGGGGRIELLEYRAPIGKSVPENSVANTPGIRHLAIEVDNLETVFSRLNDAGVPVFSEPVAVPFRLVDGIRKRLAYTLDPDGVIVEFCVHELDHGTT